MSPKVLAVAGAVSYDYLIYQMTAVDGGPYHEQGNSASLTQLVIRTGSADLIAQLLTAAAPQWNLEILRPALQQPASNCLKHNASSIIDLSQKSSSPKEKASYEVVQVRHIAKRPVWHSPPIEKAAATGATTVILSGSGDAFQDVEPALDFLQRVKPKFIVHHMTKPLAVGRLWDIIRNGPLVRDGPPDPDHLAVIIDAEDLRSEGIALSRSLSWEATAEDFVRNLGSNGRLDTLVTCPNLVVRFGNEGVIHHRGRDAADPKLYFHPRKMEVIDDKVVSPAIVVEGIWIFMLVCVLRRLLMQQRSAIRLPSLLALQWAFLIARAPSDLVCLEPNACPVLVSLRMAMIKRQTIQLPASWIF